MRDRDQDRRFSPRRPAGRPAAGRGGPPRRRPGGDRDGPVVLYGWHPVSEALRNPKRKPRRLLATENGLLRLQEEGLGERIPAEIVRPGAIDALLTADAVHQGLYLECDALRTPDLSTIAPEGIVLVLDQVTDPHNVGAILRTAAAFAVKAIVTTVRHSPEATGVLAKAASGALEHVPIVAVRNLGEAMETLGSRGFTRLGLDSEGAEDLGDLTLSAPVALVLGAEGKGLRQKTRGLCDHLARIDLPGAIRSLNVSNAAALALYAVHRAIR